VFPHISSADKETFGLLMDVVSEFKSFGEAPHLARKCGIGGSDTPIRAL
jgi:hypothetical protein